MSVMVFGSKPSQQTAPEKGSFPIDHDGECKKQMIAFMQCLADNKSNNAKCRPQSKEYLRCRMDHNLMTKEEWKKLGYSDLDEDKASGKKS